MKVFFVAPEANPYVKTGGLGDVTGTLPKYLQDLGVEVFLILPFYKIIKEKKLHLNRVFSSTLSLNGKFFFIPFTKIMIILNLIYILLKMMNFFSEMEFIVKRELII